MWKDENLRRRRHGAFAQPGAGLGGDGLVLIDQIEQARADIGLEFASTQIRRIAMPQIVMRPIPGRKLKVFRAGLGADGGEPRAR